GACTFKIRKIVLGPLARDCHFRRQLFASAQRHDPILSRMDSRGERSRQVITTYIDKSPAFVEASPSDFRLIASLQEVSGLARIGLFEQRRWRWMAGKVKQQIGWYNSKALRRRSGLV